MSSPEAYADQLWQAWLDESQRGSLRGTTVEVLREAMAQARADERDSCLALAEQLAAIEPPELPESGFRRSCVLIAAAIRARGVADGFVVADEAL